MTTLKNHPKTNPLVVEKISETVGEIWVELDRSGDMYLDDLFARLEYGKTPKDLLWMACVSEAYKMDIRK